MAALFLRQQQIGMGVMIHRPIDDSVMQSILRIDQASEVW